jgi:hypothetical protein
MTRPWGTVLIEIEQENAPMLDSDQETQDLPGKQANHLRMALVESANDTVIADGRNNTVEKTENVHVMWWALALPVLAIIVIIAAHLLDAPAATEAQSEKTGRYDSVGLEETASSQTSADQPPDGAFVSSIAYSENGALAFVNDQMAFEGAVIDGITVVKIHQDTVEFEANGRQWTQKVGE